MLKLVTRIAPLVALAAMVSVPSVMGTQIGIDRVTGYFEPGFGGGEFSISGLSMSQYDSKATATSPTYGIGFESFCLEKNEYLPYIPGKYDVQISFAAVNGGLGGGSPDPISLGTAWLYSQFAKGTLSNFDYFTGREASAKQLQNAIWMLEDESGSTWSLANPFISMVQTEFGSQLNAKANANGAYQVAVLNITRNGTVAQDQLYYLPDGGSTLAFLGFGLIGLSAYSRKSRN